MLFRHPARPDRPVRLGACMNLWPVTSGVTGDAGVDAILKGLAEVSVPLRDRLAAGAPFGVGLWIPAFVARHLATRAAARTRLLDFLAAERLDAFTFNAFPFGDFHRQGLKEDVFAPTWLEPERAAFTTDVVGFGLACAERFAWGAERHLSVSTHTGGHLPTLLQGTAQQAPALRHEVATNLAQLASAHNPTSVPVVLGLEPEPRSLAGDTRELVPLFRAIEAALAQEGTDAPPDSATPEHLQTIPTSTKASSIDAASTAAPNGRPSPRSVSANLHNFLHVGTCLDACHAAVEFESLAGCLARATTDHPLAKLQYSSALRLAAPATDPAGFDALLAQDEPVYLHQVTGLKGETLHRAADLGDLARDPDAWRALDELRCHFHVPVDLQSSGGLATTADFAGELLRLLLDTPERWGTRELHVEIETYTWSLGGFEAPGGEDSLVDGIEGEYRHVIALLEEAGYRHVAG